MRWRRSRTRGERFALSDLARRLTCPVCGSRRVAVMFQTPAPPGRNRVRALVIAAIEALGNAAQIT